MAFGEKNLMKRGLIGRLKEEHIEEKMCIVVCMKPSVSNSGRCEDKENVQKNWRNLIC